MLKTPSSQRKFGYKREIGLGVLSNLCFQYFFLVVLLDTVYILLNSIKHKLLDKFRFYNAIYTFKNYLTPIFLKISFQCQPFTAYHRNMQIYRFSEKPFIFCPLTKWGTRGIFWPLLFAKAQCESFDVCFTFKVHTLIQEKTKKEKKKKKRKERLHTPVNILYELFLARGNFFAKVNDP